MVITILIRCGLELAGISFDMMMVKAILMRKKSGMDVDCSNLVENCENDRSNLKSKHEGDEKGVRRQQYPTLLTFIKVMIVCYSHHQHPGPNSPDINENDDCGCPHPSPD